MTVVIYDDVYFFVFSAIILAHSRIVHCLKLALFTVSYNIPISFCENEKHKNFVVNW